MTFVVDPLVDKHLPILKVKDSQSVVAGVSGDWARTTGAGQTGRRLCPEGSNAEHCKEGDCSDRVTEHQES